jgi:zinc protease
MILKKTILYSCTMLIGIGSWGGACLAQHASKGTYSKQQSDHILRGTLSNGLRVVIVRNTLSPMVTTQITYLTGGYETPEGYPGTAHALEHMMFRSSKGMSGAQLHEIIGKVGAQMNAFTTNDATQFYFMAPSNYLDVLLHIEATRMNGMLLSEKDWGLEKGAIEQEVSRDISNPGFLAFEEAEKTLYASTGYEMDPLGTRPSFDITTTEILHKFYSDWYVPNNAIFVIVGDVNLQTTWNKVKGLFGGIQGHPTPARVKIKLASFQPQTINKTTPSGAGLVQFMYRLPGQMSKDYAAQQILMDVLNNARSALSELAVVGRVLGSGVDVQAFSHGGIGRISVVFAKGANVDSAKSALNDVIEQVIKNGIPKDLAEASKRAEIAKFEFNKNSSTSLATEWSNALAWQGLNSPEQAEQQLRDVTVSDINRVAREYLEPDKKITVILTPSENGKRPPNSAGFGGTESFAGDDKLDVSLPQWAATYLSKLDMPHWTLDPKQMMLPNGITLIVQPESVSKTVTIVGHIDNNAGIQEPDGQEGVNRVLGSLFDYGTKTMDRTAFHKALDAISASESAGTDFSLTVPGECLDKGVQLLAENELQPALPRQAFNVQQKELSQYLEGQMQSPQYMMDRDLRRGLFPQGDPALRQATPATVDSLTLQDAKNYFHKTYRPDLATIVMVGDITPEKAKAMVEKYFGEWKPEGPRPDVVPNPVPLNIPDYKVVNNTYASQDQVLMAQVLENMDLNNPDRYALQLGNEVLGGNGFASRLMQDIRVKHGYAYGAQSGMQFDRTRSLFFVQYACDPAKVAAVDSLIYQDLAEMQSARVSDTELQNAKQFEIRSIPVSVSSVNSIAKSLLSWSTHGEPLNQPMVAARHYLDLTAEQMQAVFKKYIRPRHLVQIVQGPLPPSH